MCVCDSHLCMVWCGLSESGDAPLMGWMAPELDDDDEEAAVYPLVETIAGGVWWICVRYGI